jgi:small subunit ribosomal protein S13
MKENKDFKHIVRVFKTDLDGNKYIIDSLRKIKGVSFSFANMACRAANIEPNKKTGTLSDKEIDSLNEVLKNANNLAPEWMLNRRKDLETGHNKHLLSSDLDFSKETDIRKLKKVKSYRGIRHALGLPLRGQRTRSNFRKNKGRGPGVIKKKGKRRGRV